MKPFCTDDVPSSSQMIVLLGPQPRFVSLREAILRLGIRGTVATVTAGWEEDEGDDAALNAALPVNAINLRLFHRTEEIFERDPEVLTLLQRRQDELRHLREVYRFRLESYLNAARQVAEFRDDLIDFEPERNASIELVRELDEQYFRRTSELCDEYDRRLELPRRASILKHVKPLQDILARAQAVAILGGHTAIILNRLRIFGLMRFTSHVPTIACSGGAMALARQIVFYHDALPQGDSYAEVLRAGVGLFEGILPLPDGAHRLRLDDRTRVMLFARRFAPQRCVILDETTWLEHRAGQWSASAGTQQLGGSGTLEDFLP